jgi:aminoglycoside phosphotransferase (APT) family kinase protein
MRYVAVSGIPTFDDYVAAYCRRTGRNAIDHLEFHKAFNLFRVAAIIQGVVGRARSSGLVDENARQQEARVRPLAQAAWREANRG